MYIRNSFIIGSVVILLVAIISGTSLGATTPTTTTASAAKTPAATTKTATPAKSTTASKTATPVTSNLSTISSVTSSGNNLIIKADATIKPTIKVLSAPDRIVIDIPNTQLSIKLLKAASVVDPFGNVSGVRTATNFGVNPSSRLVIDLTAPTKYTVKSAGNTFTLSLNMAAATNNTKPNEPVSITPSGLIDQPKPIAVASPAQNAIKPVATVKPASKAVLQEPVNEPVVEVIKPANTTAVVVPDDNIKPVNNKPSQSSGNPDIKNIAFGDNYSDENPLVTINAKDADIKDMLQMFADRANLNLIMDKSVAGNISLSINNMPFNDALNVLLKLNDLSAKKIGNTLVVAATTEFVKKDFEATVAKSIKLNNAKASDVAKIIQNSLPKTSKANIVVDERTSSILISGTQSDVDKAESIVQAVDTKTKQVLIEVKLVDLADSGTEALGTKFGGGLGGNGTGAGQFNNPSGFPVSAAGVGGINLTYNSAGGLPTGFFAQLDMLVKTNKAKVLASPIVATQENIPALVDITDKIVTGVTTQTTAGVGTTTTITTEEVGMKVELTPKISYDGSITMQVHPMLTAKGDQLNPGQGGQPIYAKVKREANTTLRVKDGETIVIAGLKQTQNSTSIVKVPFLGDLPWIGSLFSSTQTDKKVSDILILVTPHLVSDTTSDIASTAKKPEYSTGGLIK